MTKPPDGRRLELLQGTLDMLILRTLQWGPHHGHGIGQAIRAQSDDLLKVETGPLYPALLAAAGLWLESRVGRGYGRLWSAAVPIGLAIAALASTPLSMSFRYRGEPRAAIKDNMTPIGFIALQVHSVGDKVENDGMKVMWRNIRLKPLGGDQK